MLDDVDPRSRDDDDPRDVEGHWVTLVRGPSDDGTRDVIEDTRERHGEARDRDPRDPFIDDLELLRGRERELVIDGDCRYELNGDESRSLAAVGALRVVSEHDLRRDPRDEASDPRESLRHLRDEGLVRFVSLDGGERAVTLTDRGQRLLETHRRERDDRHEQAFYADVSRPRELSHDVQLYRAHLEEGERLRDAGGDVRRVVLDHELKRAYQEWLQEHNRGRADSDGRPDRDPREIEEWAREHDLPYFDESVHFPDFRIQYDVDGRHRHADVEVVTDHYRGAREAGVARGQDFDATVAAVGAGSIRA